MSAVTAWNVGALALAATLSTAVVWVPGLGTHGTAHPDTTVASASAPSLVDHSGESIVARHYARIASLSTVADELLLELCEPDRIVAFTGYSARNAAIGYRFAGKATIEGATDLERILALHPDLVLVSRIGDPRPIARLREAGLSVYDLGDMRGMTTLIENIRELAALVGHPERGELFAHRWTVRMQRVAADIAPALRKRGMYLSVYGGHLYGGSLGTSYHDVLSAAGIVDAADRYRGSPEYSAEQVLAIDPDVIVTDEAMTPRICEHGGLASLRACATPGAIVEAPSSLLADPGPAMLDAADAVRVAVYGEPRNADVTP
jgi:iron complex transport system substrate-binding protein